MSENTMTTNTDAVPMPCPMCNASLSDASASGYHHHTANDCIFSGFEVSRDDVVAWNRRAPSTQADHIADERKMVAGVVELILRDICETDPANPDLNDTVCIDISDLKTIVERHIVALAVRSGDDAATPARYFVYDYEGGHNEFTTDAERAQAHQAAIDRYLDTGCDGWSEEVTQVVSGIVTHKTVQADLQHKPAPCAVHPAHDDESCDECAAWNEWPNHDFETCCQYEPVAHAVPAPSTGEQV